MDKRCCAILSVNTAKVFPRAKEGLHSVAPANSLTLTGTLASWWLKNIPNTVPADRASLLSLSSADNSSPRHAGRPLTLSAT